MSDKQLLGVVEEAQISLELDGESLVVKGSKGRVNEKVKNYLVENKASIVDFLKSGVTLDGRNGIRVPRNAIEPRCAVITPQMLPLIDLRREDIDRIVLQVPGGVDNIQDIYGLTPLQDGILFHHRLATEGDPYLLIRQIAFPDRKRLDQFFSVVQQVIDRHDVLRTSFLWEGLSEPAQVVWRQARLSVLEVALDPHDGPVAEQLSRCFDPRRHRVDLAIAPLLNYVIAYDVEHNRWLAMQRFHHLLGDHSTLDLLRSEIYALHAHPEKKLPRAEPFRNLVAQTRFGPSQEKHEHFFRAMLGDVTEPTLAFGHADVYLQGDNISELRRTLPRGLHESLCAQARRLGVSVASLCHLAWGLVLARCVGKNYAVFGTVLLGRLQASDFARRAAGLCINSLPFRVDLSEESTESVVRRMHARLSELLLHEHASLALAQRCSGVTGKVPLFNAMLNYRHVIERQKGEDGTNGDHLFAGVELLSSEERTNYPITLSVDDYGHALGLTAQVIRPLSPDRICGYMQQALASLVEALETSPETPIGALNVLPAEERRLQLETWNATAAPYAQERCIHQLFEDQVRKSPEAPAVVHEDRVLSYGELNAEANRLAHHLIGLGVVADARVAICVERSAAMVIGLLAVLKAGGAYVPLDPAYPSERLSQIVTDASPSLVLIDRAGRGALGEAALAGRTLVDLEPLREGRSTVRSFEAVEDPQVEGLTSRHLAYVIYTSGSTGTPKGVMVEHQQVANFLSAMASILAIEPSDSWLAVTSIAFDIAGLELYLPLTWGARIVLASNQDAMDPVRLQHLMSSHAIRIMQATPATWNALLGASWRGNRELVVLCGGEAMPTHFRARFQGRCKSLWNLYGPTETTIWSSCLQVPLEAGIAGTVPIGRPIANTRIYLLDEGRQPVPVGTIGELYIGGAGVARGYFNRPELTSERFMVDPFAAEAGGRMYRTGDLARYLPDGNIEYLGRNDNQVKIRGFRIELGEIEARLSEHALVREAVVEARDTGEEKRLVAYVLPEDESIETGDLLAELRTHLATTLPDYMVPSAYVRMEAWPLTPNGKLDRKGLPAPDDEAYVRREYEAPQGEIEETLAELWQELLQVERVGRQDDFFELGGHSLTATRLLARIRQILGVELPVATVFTQSTLAGLSEAVKEAGGGRATQAALPMVSISRDQPMPLSFAQQRLWFLAQWQGVSATYHIPVALRIRGALDGRALHCALDKVLARHEGLRSVFVEVDGEPQIRLLPAMTELPLIEHDLRGREDASVELARLGKEEARAPFDLTQGPLIRGRLVQLGEEDYVLLLTQHHIVSDGWSIGVLSRELSTLYRAFQQGQGNPLPPLAIQYPDYAAWQRAWLSGERLERQIGYWREALEGAPVLLELPTDRPRQAQQEFSGARVPLVLDGELTRSLKQLSQRHGTTLFMTVLAAWSAVLSRLSGQEEVVIGTPVANRGRAETEGLIGFFVNTLALRIKLGESPSVGELLSRVRTVSLAAQDHQDLPFEQVVEIVQPPRRLNHTPIFQAVLNWRNDEVSLPDFPGLQVGLAATAYEVLKFDLELSLFELNGQIVGSLAYATALFDRSTMERHVGYLQALLHAMVADGDQAVAGIDLLSAEERRLQLETWNATAAPYAQERCIHQLFEDQVRKSPEAPAVVHGDRMLSYGELNAEANRLAHHLTELGVLPGDHVVTLLERSTTLVAAQLAILKVGAVYVPVDPQTPESRQNWIIEDCDAKLALTSPTQTARLELKTLVLHDDFFDSVTSVCDRALDLSADDAAYIMYTSGSTGTPKGVVVPHRAIGRLVINNGYADVDATDRIAFTSNPAFDASTFELWAALLNGGVLVVIDQAVLLEPERFTQVLIEKAISVLWLTVGLFNQYANSLKKALPRLRYVIVGGDSLDPGIIAWVMRECPPQHLLNAYGPTETTTFTTTYEIPAVPEQMRSIPIGRPIAQTQIYILDAQHSLLPAGAAGEIYIGGAGLAHGYLNRPELTKERFILSPFVAGERLYKTGDVGRWRSDGVIEYLGRNDFQVKIRGFRVEVGEVEARLAEYESVRAAVVLAREDRAGEKRLVAYLTVVEGATVPVEGLRAYLGSVLPEYMVPAAYVVMDAFPLTPNGKLDRKALPAPEADAYASRAYEAPHGEIEETLAEVWQQLLRVERVGRQDNFFELGGHSLLALQMIECLRQRNFRLEIRSLFMAPVLCDLAGRLQQDHGIIVPPNMITPESDVITPAMLPLIHLNQNDIDRIVKHVPGGIANIQDLYALAPLQEGVLFHHRITNDGDPYLLSSLRSFPDRELLSRFLDAVQQLVDRHDILRTAFIWEELSAPVQVVWRKAKLSVTQLELDPGEGPIAEQVAHRFDLRHQRMDLGQAPLLQYVIADDRANDRWILLQRFHHLIGDHSTMDMLRGEIAAFLAGKGDTLAPPPPFRNLVAQALLGLPAQEHERFFQEMLGDISEPTLPFGLTDVHRNGEHVSESDRMLPQALNDRLRAQARRLGVGLASLCHLAWGQVLARIVGSEHVVFGTVLFGRMQADRADRAAGLFINTLPLRLDLGEIDIESAARQVHDRLAELLTHEHASLALAQRCSGIAAPGPIFNSIINYRHTQVTGRTQGGVEQGYDLLNQIEPLGYEERTNYPITLSVDNFGEGLGLTAQVVDSLSADRICGYMQQALASLVEALETSPETPIGALNVLPAEERRLQLETWNATAAPYAEERCIHQLFEDQVRKSPEAPAVVHEDRVLSYGELNAEANRLAHHLIGLGVVADARVAICVERSAAMVIGLLAILKAGGAYVPLDPAYPSERLSQIVTDASPSLVLIDRAGREALGEAALAGRTLVDLEPLREGRSTVWSFEAVEDPQVEGLTSRHLAYVIYTSGSTGRPKGVMNEHGALVNRLMWMQEAYGLDGSDVVLQKTSFSFDVSVWEFFWTLQQGAKLLVPAPELQKDPSRLIELMVGAGVTTAHFVPSMLGVLLTTRGVERCTSLRRVICSGEALSAQQVQGCREKLPGAQLHNLYGPTEAAIDVTAWTCPISYEGGVVPIGRPIANTRIYLLDAGRQPVPLGAIGELYIGGAGVARGYFNRPELTSERFLVDPFSAEAGGRMYRTGDLARYLPDGNIEYLGRNDNQVKIRGFRIELGEVEARLSEHGLVREAVVEARDTGEEKRLVAYVLPEDESIETGDLLADLRTHLATTLPDYMVPSAYVRMEAWPLTPNGKLDRKGLPAPDDEAYVRREYEAPQGEIEETLAELWQELLQVERVGRQDNFFELGGHSLLLVQLVERLRRLNLKVDVRRLFATPVLHELAATLQQDRMIVVPPNMITPESDVITPGMLPLIDLNQEDIDLIVKQVPGGIANIQDIYALAPLQDGILFHHRLTGDEDPYLLRTMVTFPNREVLDRFLGAVQQLVDRHDILRTAFIWKGLSTPAEVVWRKAVLSVTEWELDAHVGPIAEQLARRFDAGHHHIDLTRAPLVSFIIAREPDSARWRALQLVHHLIEDAFSMRIFGEELHQILQGHGAALPPPPPFRNLVAQALLGLPLEEHERFFQEMLGDISEPTLPFGLTDVRRNGEQMSEFQRMLPQALNDRLRSQARRFGVGLASLCHLAWGQVLARIVGNERVVFGTVLFGRMQAGDGANRATGMFINTLPLRLDLGEVDVQSAVRQANDRLAELMVHEQASLVIAQRSSGVAVRTPLFSSLLNYRNVILEPAREANADIESLAGAQWARAGRYTNYPLILHLEDSGHTLGCIVHIMRPLSPERVWNYMQQALASLVEALETSPETPIGALNVLPAEERRLQLETWNATAAPYAEERCIHQLFEDQVRKSPEAPAVVHEDRVLSYGELNAEANRLAHHLVGLGVVADARVAICVERSAAMVIGLLAILKAGGAYVPLDPSYPSERLSQIVTDASPSLVLIDRAGREALGEAALAGRTLVDLEPLRERRSTVWSFEAVEDPQVEGLTSRHLAYVIYTSGSTGRPKGVMNEHGALVNRLMWMQEAYGLDNSDVVLQKTSFSFDVSVWEFFWTLQQGAKLLVPAPELQKDPSRLIELMVGAGVTTAHFVPSMLGVLLMTRGVERCTSLRRVICSGEALSAQQVQGCREKLPGAQLHNLYGPTEAAIDVTAWTCPISYEGGVVPIGRPIANTRIYLLDAGRQPVPLGAIGELYIGGAGVARGYLNRPELTSERFMVDPFSAEAGGRMYRTGDLARYLPDGNIEYLGRNDNQVKIRGFRIELGEVEARLSEHALVREAVVEARDTGEEKRLVAYVLPEDESIETGDLLTELRAQLATTLPDYMVPSAYVRMEAWPLTPNGKLDRKGLPAPDDEAYVRSEYEAPQGEIEETLAELWQELLQVERVGRQDNFFELGGHSLTATRLLARISQLLGVELPVATVFARPTLMTQAQALAEASQTSSAVSPMVSISRDQPMPLSFAQQRLWFLAQLEGVSATYHIPSALRLRGALDVLALRRALDTVLVRHEGLRSVFVAVDGEPQVRLLPVTTELPLIEHDLRGREDASVELARLGKEEARTPFDLTQGPLIRGRLVQLGEEDHVLLLTQHHIVSDGWSIGVLSRELSTLYRAFQQGQGNPLPPLAIQYPDYAAWQRAWLSGERLERQIGYWREALAAAPVLLELPTDRPRQAQQDFSGGRVPLVLDGELTRSLKQLSQRHGATLFMTVMAAWSAVLSRLSGQEEVVIGTPVANRGRAETEGLIGFFVNTLALRIKLGESPSVGELLSRVRTVSLAAQDHQDLPFEQVVEIVQPPRRLNHTPIFQAVLNWQNNEVSLPDFAGVQVGLAPTSYGVVTFDLELYLSELNGQIVGSLAYATALFDRSTMERHVGYLQALLRAMVADSDQAVAGIDLLSAEERRLQLETWNATAAPYAQERCIHQLFEDQVRKSPEAPAVVHEDRVLSYGELNAEANRLAHHLIGLGVVADARVAICVERSAAMVIGLLAILKAGGAYVPLDPSYPSERLSQIVTDASPSLVLIDRAGREALGEAALAGRTLVDLEPLREGRATVWSLQLVEDPQVEELTSRHLAYVIYTSGSTGTPKGVMVEHANLISYTLGAIDLFRLSRLDTVLQQNTLNFDLSVEEIFPALISGAVLAVSSRIFGANHESLSCLRPTFVHLTAAHWHALVSEWHNSPNLAQKQLNGVRLINVTGDAISSQKLQIWETCRPQHVSLVNTYGPTEATVSCTAAYLKHDHAVGNGMPAIATIGRPMANASIYLLGSNGLPVPLGAIGELYVGGAGVARGYLNRPDLTAERFLPDPFSSKFEARMYRTGDLARYLRDGNLEFLGRNDQQVKIRGFRVEPGDIEARLMEYAGVQEAVVIPREDAPGDKRLVAYMVLASDSPAALMTSLRKDLSVRLPDYMIPAAFVHLDIFPLTPNGKLDRKALPAPDADVCVHRTFEAPQGKVEQTLAALWCELLRLERVSRRDHFFELGGHSLLAMNLIMKVRKTFGCDVALRDLFSGPTLAEFATLIHTRRPDETYKNLVSIRPKGSVAPLFFVHAGGGAVDYARQIAPAIDPAIPIHGLNATGLTVGEKPLATVPQMAERYVQCIRQMQPYGPYRLTGWSDGGTIAYEMAKTLLEAGENVEFLGLIDTLHVSDDHSAMREAFDDKVELLQLLSSRTEPAQFEQIKTLAERLNFPQMVDQIYALHLVPKEMEALPAFEADAVRAMLITRHATTRAVRTHLQEKLSIPVWFFEAQENDLSSSASWRDLLGDQLRVIAMPGDHRQLMLDEANRRVLGAAISEILVQAA